MSTFRFKGAAARLLPLLACLAVLLGALTAGPGAHAESRVTARLRPDYTIVIDGAARTFYNANGQQVHPLSYQDTTYLPVRAIGELMGKIVTWTEDTKTVTLSGVRTGEAAKGTPTEAEVRDVSAEERDDFTVVVDGTVRTFADANGKTVYPLLYQGSTYLPLRAIGELMSKTVSWDEAARTITLSSASGTTVTDADVIIPGGDAAPPQDAVKLVSAEDAKAAALAHAGLTAGEVTFTKQELEWEDGRQVYDIEFYTAAYAEYDYEIDAATGEVTGFDYDAESYTPPANSAGTAITKEKAQEIALAKVPGAKAEHVKKLKLDREDGRQVYDVEIVYNGMEYEMEIDASSGTIRDFEAEPTRK